MSCIDTLVCTDARKTRYRFVVLTMIFLIYAINYTDRTSVGTVLSFIIGESHINNFEVGAIASTFFLGYAMSQIPAGLFIAKCDTRGLVSLSIFGPSVLAWLMGAVSSVFDLKLAHLGLGLNEGPYPVGLASTIDNWFPPKEKITAAGVYIAATMFTPIIVPPLTVWVAMTWGWRWVSFSFAIPGIVTTIAWYLLAELKPSESGFASQSELMKISAGRESHNSSVHESILIAGQFTWLDKVIRVKKVAPIDTAKDLFISENILGDCLAYLMMVSVLYGLSTWIPLYLVRERGFDVMSMGLVASIPCIGGFTGAIGGRWIPDKVLDRRRRPTMMFTATSTVVVMLITLNIPVSTPAVCIGLFFIDFCLNIGQPVFTAYGMAVSDSRAYPTAFSIISSGGNLSGFVAPMATGFLLDKTGSLSSTFTYFGICAAIGLVVILFLDKSQ